MAHKTTSGNQSEAWKDLENRVAELFRRAGFRGSKRVIKETHQSLPDVDVPGIPELAIDTKYTSRGFPQHSQFMAEVETYVEARNMHGGRYTWAAMPFRPAGSKDILVVLRLEVFVEMLRRVFLRDQEEVDGGHWLCPRCPSRIEKIATWDGHNQYRCLDCKLEFQTTHIETPEKEEALRSQREKAKNREPKTLIKDKSGTTSDEFQPQSGQLTLAELRRRKELKDLKEQQKATRSQKPKERKDP